MTTKIVITGLIGSGKSTAIEYFKKSGIPCITLDDLAKEALNKNTNAYNAVVEKLGKDFLLDNNEIDRIKLREYAFNNGEIKWLEKLIHPVVLDKLNSWVNSLNSEYCIIEAPPIEAIDFLKIADKLVVITCDQDKLFERVKARDGVDKDSVIAILNNQILETKLCELADIVVENNQDIDGLLSVLEVVSDKLCK